MNASTREGRGWLFLALAAVVALVFYALGGAYDGWALGLGSIREPTQRHLVFLFYFTAFGTVAAGLAAVGIVQAFHGDAWWQGWDERRFLLRATVVALAVPVALRLLVLDGMPIADDESLYRFGAELLTRGRLTADSHPMRLFFDHAFLVNGGERFSQYFLGWPAFLAVGVLVGLPGFVNAVLSALTVLPLYRLVESMAGRLWAQVVVMVFLVSPMLQLLAATELAHTSALCALTWTAWAAWRAMADPEAWGPALGVGLAFSVAFFIRPLTALGIGAPFVVGWGRAWWRGGRPLRPAVAFLVPALGLAVAFLMVNQLQTGSALKPAYMAWQEYTRGNAFRFSGLDPARVPAVPNLAVSGPAEALRTVFLGLLRLSYALLGWPSAFLLLPLAAGVAGTGLFWSAIGLFLLLHTPLRDPGIDTLGPVHFTELALPVLVLTGVGAARAAHGWDERVRNAGVLGQGGSDTLGRRVALAVVAALTLASLVLYTPQRLRAVSRATTLVGIPFQALEQAGVEDAVVFSSVPWAVPCNPVMDVPSRPFVFWWPVNEPDFTDDVLHANHLSTAADRALMAEFFPERRGWILQWNPDCTLSLVPLDAPEAETVPNGIMVSGSLGTVRWDEGHPPTGEVPEGFGR